MNRFSGSFFIFVLAVSTAWAQAPAPQNAAPAAQNNTQAAQPAAASSQGDQTSVSGCMTQNFGRFTVADNSSKSWEIRGINLWDHQNHVVSIKGLVDPKSATPLLYAQNVQDTGQPCGNAQAAGGSSATPATAGAQGQGTTAAQPGTTGSTPATNAQPGSQTPGTAGAEPSATTAQPATPQASNAAPAQSNLPASASASGTSSQTSAEASQTGTTGVTQSSSTPQSSENKGVLSAGSPQGAIASNAQPQAGQSGSQYSVFTGCLVGSMNNYQFKSSGKTYRLQGNTLNLSAMVNHQVEVTGQDFNGKAIQVNGARDLGSSCK